MDPDMRIGIIGVGGIGGYFAAKLLSRYHQEHDIVFLQRGPHLEAIRKQGLRYLTRDHEYRVQPRLASDRPGDLGLLDMAVLCVKSRGLKEAACSLAACLQRDSPVLTVLNGVDIEPRVRACLPDSRILPGCIYLSAHIESPGLVRQVGGAGPFYFGPREKDVANFRWVEEILQGAGIKAILTEDIELRLWQKFLFVGPLATLTGATGLTIGQAVREPTAREQFIGLMKEIISLASARGIRLEEEWIDKNLELAQSIPPQTKTSMQLDIENGRPAELDVFTRFVIEESRRLGIEAPIHSALYSKIEERIG